MAFIHTALRRTAVILPGRALATARPLSTSTVRLADKGSSNSVSYEDLKKYTQQPSADVIVIDTREPDEAANNPIPATVNVPLSRLAEVFDPNFHPGIFQRDFGFNKPSIDQKLIFLDRSGKNAPKAVEIVKGLGYPNARGVSGGTQEWNEKQAKEKK